MPVSWKTPEQRNFLKELVPAYQRSIAGGSRKEFWEMMTESWFKRFPLEPPSAEEIAEVETVEKALEAARLKRIKQLKRYFSGTGDNSSNSHTNLGLDENRPRKRSELQVYMSLYYDSRIRKVVVERWAKDGLPQLEGNPPFEIPEEDISLEESAVFKDFKIPISFKNAIAQELWENEDEVVKSNVRSQRGSEIAPRTVYNTEGKERLDILEQYVKNTSGLHKNMVNVLRNVESKCGGKGIMWIACPSPLSEGKPVGYFQCIGETSRCKDFEEFIGPEKTKEFKALFGAWVQKIYPLSEWGMFDIRQYGSGNKPSDSTEHLDEQGIDDGDIDLSDGELPAVAKDAHIQSQATLSFGANTQPGISVVQGRSPSFIDPTQPTTPPLSCVASNPQPPPLVLATKPRWTPATENAGTQDSNPVPTICVEDTHLSDSFSIPSQLPTIHPSRLTAPVPRARANTSDLSRSPSPSVDDSAIPTFPKPAGEPLWMQQKETLKYFRKIMKEGHLATLISNWYRFEKLLGFPDQTSKKLPTQSRPKVVAAFFKSGHKYERSYGLNADSLGREILAWWDEISEEGPIDAGGPTGIYTMVVLASWWSKLLENDPHSDRTQFSIFVDNFNNAILEAINDPTTRPSTIDYLRLTSSPPPSQYTRVNAKRALSEEGSSSRKRARK